jgi:hypothetical protein
VQTLAYQGANRSPLGHGVRVVVVEPDQLVGIVRTARAGETLKGFIAEAITTEIARRIARSEAKPAGRASVANNMIAPSRSSSDDRFGFG